MDPVTSVLAISELQERIFSYNERADSARCARVCRGWLEVALDRIWRALHNIRPLLAVLSLLILRESEDRNYLHFSRAPRPSDWKRFYFYATRVKTLTIGQDIYMDEGEKGELHKDLLYELAMSRPAICILPNLVNISFVEIFDNVDILLSYLHLFLHGTVKHLGFNLVNWDTQFSDSVLVQLSAKCLDLRSLRLYRRGQNGIHQTIQRLLQDFVKSQKNLENLETFSSIISSDFFMSLGRMEKLHSIYIFDTWFFEGETTVVPFQEAMIQSDMFPALRELKLPAFPEIIRPLLDFQLYKLAILEKLSKSFIGLEDLSVDGRLILPNVESQALARIPITAATLWQLPRFPDLHSVSIYHDKAIDISDTELAAIILRSRTLRKLILNPTPHNKTETPRYLTLNLLGLIATHTQLRHLELYVDATVDVTPSNAPILLFDGLKRLEIADSPISTAIHAAAYLSQVLPSSCEFVVPRCYSQTRNSVVGIWGEVKTILSVLLPYRRRFESLEAENKQLKAILEESEISCELS